MSLTPTLIADWKLLETGLNEVIRRTYGEKFYLLYREFLEINNLNILTERAALLTLEELKKIIHSLTVRFLLFNQAEQVEIARRVALRNKELKNRESIRSAIKENTESIILKPPQIDLIPTLTAHPTEAKRRTTLEQLKGVSDILKLSEKSQDHHKDLNLLISLILLSDGVRAERLTVEDEIKNCLFFLSNTLSFLLPEIKNELSWSLEEEKLPPAQIDLQIKFRSWIGGDRDGNPNVTASVTRLAVKMYREELLKIYKEDIRKLKRLLSISIRQIPLTSSTELSEIIKEAKEKLGNSELRTQDLLEPFRLFFAALEKEITAGDFTLSNLRKRLENFKVLLSENKLDYFLEHSSVKSFLNKVEIFGLGFVSLDLRQHSLIHKQLIGSIFNLENYSSLSEKEREKFLTLAIKQKRKWEGQALTPEAEEFKELVELAVSEKENGTFSSYIVSMTHSAEDLLEVVALWYAFTDEEFYLDLVPLFETVEDLKKSTVILDSLFRHPLYADILRKKGNFQEIMLGYSDSNKDGGFLSANVNLQRAQKEIASLCRKYNVEFRLFHGRGGSVGRGGGRTGKAIMAAPPESQNGRIRFTEQGEVISFRYLMPELGHRHLEQIINALISSQCRKGGMLEDSDYLVLEKLSEWSLEKYSSLVHHPDFWEWFSAVTPIFHIGTLPLASRPVSRGKGGLNLESVRAIPWNFAWTQTRYNVPSWYGVGTALKRFIEENHDNIEALQKMYWEKEFFRVIIDNCQQELARARLSISGRYAALSDKNFFHSEIQTEYELTKENVLKVTGQKELLENSPVVLATIKARNPATDILNILQIELLKRFIKEEDTSIEKEIGEVIHGSINGIAAAMQGTG